MTFRNKEQIRGVYARCSAKIFELEEREMKKLAAICLGVVIGFVSFVTVPAQEIPKVIKGGFLNGKAIHLPEPEYPAEAKAAGAEGIVFVDVTIDESGNVTSAVAEPERSKAGAASDRTEVIDPRLVSAAEKAALEAKFSPTQLRGVPVKVFGTLVYTFSLSSQPVDVNGGILNGRATSLPKPAYPEAAKAVRATGPVAVRIIIDENGDVIEAAALSGHPLLRAAAVEAAKTAKFSPTRLSGQPVKVSGVLAYNFVLPTKEEN